MTGRRTKRSALIVRGLVRGVFAGLISSLALFATAAAALWGGALNEPTGAIIALITLFVMVGCPGMLVGVPVVSTLLHFVAASQHKPDELEELDQGGRPQSGSFKRDLAVVFGLVAASLLPSLAAMWWVVTSLRS